MRYLVPLLVVVLMISGCVTGRLPIADRSDQSHANVLKNSDPGSHEERPTSGKRPGAPTQGQPIKAAFSEHEYLDLF